HRLDVGARPADLAVAVNHLIALDHGEVERPAAALALLVVPLTLAAPEANHLAAGHRAVVEEHDLMPALARADVLVPEQLEEIPGPRVDELVVAEADAGPGVLDERSGAGTVRIEYLERALAVHAP